MERSAIVALSAIAVFGTPTTAQALLTEGLTMNGSHWIMLLVAVAAGYVAARLFPAPGKMIGLP